MKEIKKKFQDHNETITNLINENMKLKEEIEITKNIIQQTRDEIKQA